MSFTRKVVILGCLGFLMAGCGGSSSSTSGEDSTGTGTGTGTETGATATNALAVAFPDDLAVSSMTASTGSGSSSLSALSLKNATLNPEDFEDAKERIHDNLVEDEIGNVKVEGIDFQGSAPAANCYGPTLFLSGTHPDTGMTIPDGQDMLPGNDLGIWEETEETTGEACIAALMNKQIGEIENILKLGLEGGAATLAAKNVLDGDTLPAKGASIDLTSAATTVLQNSGFDPQINTATLARAASNSSDGYPVFNMNMGATITLTIPQVGSDSMDMSFSLHHIPEVTDPGTAALVVGGAKRVVEDDDTYRGRFQQKFEVPAFGQMGGNCGNNNPVTECVSITYDKSSTTSMTIHMRRGQFCGTYDQVDCFDANGDVDPDNKNPPHGWGNDFFYIICQQNPVDGSGSCTHAWQAGAMDGHTRTANVTLDAGGNSGCGWYGYGPDVGADSGVGSIDGMICNWAGPGSAPFGNKIVAELAQRQCFSRNSSGILASISTDTDGDSVAEGLAITYAPTNSCNKAAGTFAYGTQEPPTDVPASQAVTNNLIDIDEVVFTVPTPPVID